MTHYCHNCGHHAQLPDGTHCAWCLQFFGVNRRLPRPGDKLAEPRTALERAYAALGWETS